MMIVMMFAIGSNMDYLKKTISIANQHYPERSYVIYILNAPFYASMMWKIVKPLVRNMMMMGMMIMLIVMMMIMMMIRYSYL